MVNKLLKLFVFAIILGFLNYWSVEGAAVVFAWFGIALTSMDVCVLFFKKIIVFNKGMNEQKNNFENNQDYYKEHKIPEQNEKERKNTIENKGEEE